MPTRLFVVGASWNGLQALCELVSSLPEDFPAPIFIVQHTSPEGPSRLPQILSKAGSLPASHAQQGEFFRAGNIYVAPPDHHMLLRRQYVLLSRGPHENQTRPAVDVLFRSAALAYGPTVVGVVLSGHLDDGTAGLMTIKGGGGIAIVQQPSEATAPSMPESALRHVQDVDHCCNVKEIAALFIQLAKGDPQFPTAPVDPVLEVEDRIAGGVSTLPDWELLEDRSRYCGLTCPECHSSLCELPGTSFLRFRCRAGHAFSPQSLVYAQATARESTLSSLYGWLREELALVDRLLADPAYRTAGFTDELAERAARLRHSAAQIARSTGQFDVDCERTSRTALVAPAAS